MTREMLQDKKGTLLVTCGELGVTVDFTCKTDARMGSTVWIHFSFDSIRYQMSTISHSCEDSAERLTQAFARIVGVPYDQLQVSAKPKLNPPRKRSI